MTAPSGSPAPAASLRPPRRSVSQVLAALRRPKVGLMLALGFSSGLPFMLIGNTLGFWLAENGVTLAAIGFLSWAAIPYLFKFIWGAAADRLRLPLIGALGRRRSWMVVSQIAVAAGLIGMAATDPKRHLAVLAAFALLAGLGAATQDTVIDAWRIESADDADELGLLTAAYSLGFRAALIATEALILLIAKAIGWPVSYALYGGAMIIGLAAALAACEPATADAVMDAKSAGARAHPARAVFDAVIGPIIVFFRTHGWGLAILMLGMITLYHLSDYLRGPMSNPFYVTLKIDKVTLAAVRATVGLAGTLAGIAAGGMASLRLGNLRTLIVGAILQPIGVAAFALLAWRGGDFNVVSIGPMSLTAFQAIMTFDGFAIGFSGVALVSYMSTLTSLGYTATQYALLTSALAWSGKILKGFSGLIVEGLHHGRSLTQAYGLFYLLAAAIGVPAIALCIVLAVRRRRSVVATESAALS